MTVSGTSTFNPAATFIMTFAFRKLSAIDENETPTAGMYQDALFSLNSLVKEWMASGIHVWTEEEGILFLQPNQQRYLLGGSSTDNTSDANEYELTTLTTTATISATSFVVGSTSGFTVADHVGIVLDNGTTQWTTVSTIPTSTTFTIPSPGLTSSASAGGFVFNYTTKIVRPLRIPRARRLILTGLIENSMIVQSRKDYMNLPNKAAQGTPNVFFYNPRLSEGELFIWPVPTDSSSAIRFTWYRPLQDFNDPGDTSDIPQEWINALVWNLAVEMAPDYDIPPQRFQVIKALADEKLDLVRGWDREPESIQFVMGGFD